ncbi:MAG: MotA/TolQ/ExbB proton channel family protein [Verrucomicrobia bacterium]|nr:MotA/TolQ/ExbB proton channel family protein [Verrucomicrobiota bacterium]
MIRFHCSKCAMKLMVEPEYAGSNVSCPSCGINLTVPNAPATGEGDAAQSGRQAWKETDPTNPNIWIALGIGCGIFVLIYLMALPIKYFKGLLWERGWVQFAETFFFGWGIAFLVLKLLKLRHQQSALRLDVMPQELGTEVNKGNVLVFIQHVYSLPVQLRDSLMVNRIRKALELFESRQVNGEVATMMSNQSNIDGSRIGGSYTLVKVFIWAIPILGFIGTVIGLSDAIGNFSGVMSPDAVKDPTLMMKSMGGVTSGLASAFDTTLLAIIYSIILSLPMSSLQKTEEDNLSNIDAYCNEILLPRLNDGSNTSGGDLGAQSEVLNTTLTQAHTRFLAGLDAAAKLMREQSQGFERRAHENGKVLEDAIRPAAQQMAALAESAKAAADQLPELQRQTREALASAQRAFDENLSRFQSENTRAMEDTFRPVGQQLTALASGINATTAQLTTLDRHAQEHQATVARSVETNVTKFQTDAARAADEAMRTANAQLAVLAQGIAALNQTLVQLNGKQIIVQQVPKAGILSRLMGKG